MCIIRDIAHGGWRRKLNRVEQIPVLWEAGDVVGPVTVLAGFSTILEVHREQFSEKLGTLGLGETLEVIFNARCAAGEPGLLKRITDLVDAIGTREG
jgi:hypothetical protein